MAGGSGTRFWPWSRESQPKQLLALASRRSMLADTVARLRGIVPPANVVVVVGRSHRARVLAELPGLAPESVLAEPVGRNTAACIGWATSEILRRRPDAVTAVFSADHVIGDPTRFRRDLDEAWRVADDHRVLVTIGIPPVSPATGYGYIRAGAAVAAGTKARAVGAFVEKPNLATAKRYVASGKYYWNAGIFVWRADVVLAELRRHLPALVRGLDEMNRHRRRGTVPPAVVERVYPRLPALSIDYAVLEKSDRVAVLPASFSWSDIGSWDAVAGLWPADRDGNGTRDPMIAVDSNRNVVATGGKPVVLVGVSGLVVVDAGDALLVCARDRSQEVRNVPELLRKARLDRLR